MVTICSKEESEQLSDKLARLTVNVDDRECKNEPADPVANSETCKTPTAKEHRIPEAMTCPPAPRKRKVSFFADKHEPKKTVDEKVIETIFSPAHDSSKTSPRQ
ncbi:hypothetical protein CRYUN_Cryun01aG0204300 [Craigia yunnanensis]